MRAFPAKSGLAATTQGPGYTNATTSLVLARLHRSPVLMLAGHASLRDPYNPEGMIDQHALAKLTAEATVKIDHPNNIDYCIGEAFRQRKARKGPFVLNMPQDVQHSAVPDEKWTYRPMYKAKALQPPRQEDIAQPAKILADAKRPTILADLTRLKERPSPPHGLTIRDTCVRRPVSDYPLWVTGCLPECVSATSGVPQIAADLLHRASR